MEEEEKVILSIDTGGSVETIKNLRLSLRQARSAMLESEIGSVEYAKALRQAGAAQSRLNDISQDTRQAAADYTRVIGQSTRALGGLVGGIGAVNGVMALMGGESEALNKTFVKLQAGMAVTQGLNGFAGMLKTVQDLTRAFRASNIGIKTLTVTQKIYNAVLNANPIFLLVTVIAAVVSGIYLLTKALGKQKDEQVDLNKHTEDYLILRQELTDSYSFEIRMMEANGKTATEIHNRKMAQNAQLTRDSMNRINELTAMQAGASKKRKKEIQEEIDKEKKLYDKAIDDRKKLEQDFTVFKAKEATRQAEEQAKKDEKAKTDAVAHQAKLKDLRDKDLQEIKKIQDDLELDLYSQEDREKLIAGRIYKKKLELFKKYKKDTTELTTAYEKEIADISEKYTVKTTNEKLEAAKALAEDAKIKFEESEEQLRLSNMTELEILEERHAQELELLTEFGLSTTEIEVIQAAEKAELIGEIEKKALDDEMERIDKKKNFWMAAFDEMLNAGANFTNALGSLNDARMEQELANAGDNEEAKEAIRKKAFEKNKKMEVANTLMAGLKGIVNAMSAATVLPEPFGMALKVANAAAIGVTTGANVAKIKATKYEGGGGGSVSSPSRSNTPSMPRMPSAPQMDNSINFVRNITTEDEDLQAQRPIRAYVVESDISEKQDRVNRAREEASF